MKKHNINVIIAAAGLSQRYGVKNKLFEKCGAGVVLTEAIKPFLAFDEVKKVIVAIDSSYFDELMQSLSFARLDEEKRITASIGGSSRTKTVANALGSLTEDCDAVLIHDGARPYVSANLVERIIRKLDDCNAVVPLLATVDNIAQVKDGKAFPDVRDKYRLVQTPCGFERGLCERAYTLSTEDSLDDLTVISKICPDVHFVDGEKGNIKITTSADLYPHLVGCGYDIHRMQDGKGIYLMGELIPCPYSFIAHSDGDVPIHAIMDALLSAIGEKDIGHLFPVDDSTYDNADSMVLLNQVLQLVKAKGYTLENLSVTIIAQEPKISTHIDRMRVRACKALDLPSDKIGITATTNEEVGELGSAKAIASYATVLLRRL